MTGFPFGFLLATAATWRSGGSLDPFAFQGTPEGQVVGSLSHLLEPPTGGSNPRSLKESESEG